MSAASPGSLEELRGVLGVAADWVAVAGGTDLLVRTPEERAALIPTLDLLRVPELQGIADEGDTWRVGATTSFTAIREHTALAKDLPILAQAAGVVGGWQIQNRATLGGNMANASPAGDSLPVLLALEAQLTLVGPDGDREVAYSAFHTGYRQTALARNEVIGWIRIPKPPADSVQRYRKVGTREAQAISKIVVALSARRSGNALSEVRLAAGSVAATPVRLPLAEQACSQGTLTAALCDQVGQVAANEVTPIDDVRSTADYRRHALERVVRRMLRDLLPAG